MRINTNVSALMAAARMAMMQPDQKTAEAVRRSGKTSANAASYGVASRIPSNRDRKAATMHEAREIGWRGRSVRKARKFLARIDRVGRGRIVIDDF